MGTVRTYPSVQILRGLAALLVVASHAGHMATENFGAVGQHFMPLRAGAAGVDIFFAISGFVMVVSTTSLIGRPDAWRVFLKRRIVRIVPLYWLATTLKLVLLLAIPALALHAALSVTNALGSYFFIFTPNPNGGTDPIVVVGWTLNFEMFFYAVFAAALFVRGPLVLTVGGAMAFVAALGLTAVPAGWQPLRVCDPIVIEFVAGMLIARVTLAGYCLGPRSALALGAVALVCLCATDDVSNGGRLLDWGLPGAALVVAAVALDPCIGKGSWHLARRLGDASYSIYLSHGFVIDAFRVVLTHLLPRGIAAAGLSVGGAVLLSAIVGLKVHDWVEQPLLRLRPKTPHRARPAAAAPLAVDAAAIGPDAGGLIESQPSLGA